MVNWKAVVYGIVAAFALGILSGVGLPFTDATLPVVGAGVTGLIAGGVAGYVARGGLGSGALHGFLATTIGGLLVGAVLLVVGTLAAGIFGFGAAVLFLTLVVAHGVPGAVGGAIGGIVAPKERRASQPVA